MLTLTWVWVTCVSAGVTYSDSATRTFFSSSTDTTTSGYPRAGHKGQVSGECVYSDNGHTVKVKYNETADGEVSATSEGANEEAALALLKKCQTRNFNTENEDNGENEDNRENEENGENKENEDNRENEDNGENKENEERAKEAEKKTQHEDYTQHETSNSRDETQHETHYYTTGRNYTPSSGDTPHSEDQSSIPSSSSSDTTHRSPGVTCFKADGCNNNNNSGGVYAPSSALLLLLLTITLLSLPLPQA